VTHLGSEQTGIRFFYISSIYASNFVVDPTKFEGSFVSQWKFNVTRDWCDAYGIR